MKQCNKSGLRSLFPEHLAAAFKIMHVCVQKEKKGEKEADCD